MSLTSIVNDRHSFLWGMMSPIDKAHLQSFCDKLTKDITLQASHSEVYIRPQCASNEAALVGMAMRYALMYTFGAKHLRTHPISVLCHDNDDFPYFDDLINQFGSQVDAGLLFLALADHVHRNHTCLDPAQERWYDQGLNLRHGMRVLSLDGEDRLNAALWDIGNLAAGVRYHFNKPSVVGLTVFCRYCGTGACVPL